MKNEQNYIFSSPFNGVSDIARLSEQHLIVAQATGLFTPYFAPRGDETLVDIGCGPGSWALDVAFVYPDVRVVGLDRNESTIQYAMTRATKEHADNVSFEVHDVTTGLPFQNESVDYINLSLANSFLLKDQWPQLFTECQRILRPGGWLRSIEWLVTQTSSPAIFKLLQMFNEVLQKDGRRYVEPAPFIEHHLMSARLFPLPSTVKVVNFSQDTAAHMIFSDDLYISLILFAEHFNMQEEFEKTLELARRDMLLLPDFYAYTYFSDLAAKNESMPVRETTQENEETAQ